MMNKVFLSSVAFVPSEIKRADTLPPGRVKAWLPDSWVYCLACLLMRRAEALLCTLCIFGTATFLAWPSIGVRQQTNRSPRKSGLRAVQDGDASHKKVCDVSELG